MYFLKKLNNIESCTLLNASTLNHNHEIDAICCPDNQL